MSSFTVFPVPLASPLEVLAFYDDSINSGEARIYDWQKERLETFVGNADKSIIYEAVIAANGVGKSQYILAPCAVYNALVYVESLTIVTTASGEQLDTQAFRYIKRLCERVNALHKEELGIDVFKINYRQIYCNITGSFIDLFATDEPGKAEGRHPISNNGQFAIIVDEAKTVSDEIFAALERCTGITRRLDLSSPGDCSGYFYDICTHPDTPYDIRKVTAFECPHIKKEEIEWKIKKYGLNDPLIRSSIFAEFTSVQDSVVITRAKLLECIKFCSQEKFFGEKRAGLDLSAGGNETVLSVWLGNIQLAQECFRYSDTTKGRDEVITMIIKHKLKPQNIFADDGGIGRSMIDMLAEKGYKVNRVLNNSRAVDYSRYANRGTELWYNFSRFVEENLVKLIKDSMLIDQLSNRYHRRQAGTGKLILELKKEAIAKGHPSPDRADACVLAWLPYVYPLDNEPEKPNERIGGGLSGTDLAILLSRQILQRSGIINAEGNITTDSKYKVTNRFCNFNQANILGIGSDSISRIKRKYNIK